MLYQQGTQRIEVVVRKESGGGSDTNAKEIDTDSAGSGKTTWRTSLFGSENPKRIKRVAVTNATHFLAVSRQIFGLAAEYQISGLAYHNGDQAYQNQVNRQVEIVKDVTGAASSVGMGALYGAWGGPIGAVLGGLMAGLSSGVSLAVKYKGRERDFSYKMFKENNAIEYKRARAQVNLTTGRLR